MSTNNEDVRDGGGADPQALLVDILRGLQEQMRSMQVVMDQQQQALVGAGLSRTRSRPDLVREQDPEVEEGD